MQDHGLTRLTSEQILARLKVALAAEIRAAADYEAHARACAAAGAPQDVCHALVSLRDVEQEHALRLAARITALGGVPSSASPGAPAGSEGTGDALARWLEDDLAAEQWAIVEYARLVATILNDDETADLLAELLVDEIRHAAWLKSALRTLSAEG